MDSYVIGKERCPRCAKLGKDRSEDNLAVYSDGHKFCYSCKYTENLSTIRRFKQKMEQDNIDIWPKEKYLYLPTDCDIVYPDRALKWIESYGLTRTDLLNNNVLWSDSYQRLIFPVYGDNGTLIAWQGRSFSNSDMAIAKIPKWYGKGDLKNTFHFLGKGNILVLTEDIISAIKVAKAGFMSMPLFGCVVGRERFKRLYSLYKDTVEVVVWLDDDKRLEGIKEARLGAICGLKTKVVSTELDPKELNYEQIREKLERKS